MHCDVLIVGGGPAGLAAAIALRQQGADVVLADALKPPIDKPCGEGLMPDSRRELAKLGIELEAHHGAEFAGILFAGHAGKKMRQVAAAFPDGLGLGIRRPALHRLLLQRALDLGVRTFWGHPVVLRSTPSINGRSVACRWLIGADGHASPMRRWARLDEATLRSRRFGFRAHYHVEPWSPFVEVHWGSAGQAYITPVGPREVCMAAITRHPQFRMENVIATIPFLQEKLARAEMTTKERGALTLTRRLRRVTRGNVALIGDASGSADAITGEGLASGFRQALLLSESLKRGGLGDYEAGHAKILALPQQMAAAMLLMDRFPALQNRALPVLAARPEIFRAMLAVHVGAKPLPEFLVRYGAQFGSLLLAPRLAQASQSTT